MVRVVALNWKERYRMTGWPWRIVVRWALLDTRAPCELAWTWCTGACWEIGGNMTHCYLTLAPKYCGMPGA